MDFLDFDNHDLYFDEPMSTSDEMLLQKAADAYPSKDTETILLDLQWRLPNNLTVIVALYRFYYYQHRYEDALDIADKALDISAAMMGLKIDWRELSESHLAKGVFVSMGLIRFYMLGLKAAAYLFMRLDNIAEAYDRLSKIIELDPADQFGATFLYELAKKELSVKFAEQHNVQSLYQH